MKNILDEEPVKTEMVNNSDGSITAYEGYPGIMTISDTEKKWAISRTTISSTGATTTLWADGNTDKVNAWSDRATLLYTNIH